MKPGANLMMAALAAKHLGAYVWGGRARTGFDCSGLVQYSYRTAAGSSLPRVSQDQFRAARIIPASRAVAGDLVFYHDNTGSVYHVGIYTSPAAATPRSTRPRASGSSRSGIPPQPTAVHPQLSGAG